MRSKTYSLALAAATTLFASNALAHDFLPLSSFPQWFQDAANRTVDISKTSTVEVPDFNMKQSMQGDWQLQDSDGNYWYYQVNIGSDVPVECYIYKEYDGASNSLHSIIEYSFEGIQKINQKTLSSKFNYSLDTGVIDDTPFIRYDTLYSLGEGAEKVSGILKSASATTRESLQVCVHNEVGYDSAFEEVFSSFVTGFINSEESPEFFESVYFLTINDMPMGFMREQYSYDSEGDVKIYNETSIMLAVDQSNVARTDTILHGWSSQDGMLINSTEYTVENGELASEYTIRPQEENWVVSGKMQGKNIDVTIESTDLVSGYGNYVYTDRLRKSDDSSTSFNMFVPDADPTSAITVNMKKITDNDESNFVVNMGPLSVYYLADDNYVTQKGYIAQGPNRINLTLAYTRGAPIKQ